MYLYFMYVLLSDLGDCMTLILEDYGYYSPFQILLFVLYRELNDQIDTDLIHLKI